MEYSQSVLATLYGGFGEASRKSGYSCHCKALQMSHSPVIITSVRCPVLQSLSSKADLMCGTILGLKHPSQRKERQAELPAIMSGLHENPCYYACTRPLQESLT